jgi:hypothetical protein
MNETLRHVSSVDNHLFTLEYLALISRQMYL